MKRNSGASRSLKAELSVIEIEGYSHGRWLFLLPF